MSPAEAISACIAEIEAMLLSKNAAYGNSAWEPLRLFSKASPIEQLKVRIDDKISRLAKGEEAGEDTITDLIGYLVMLKAYPKWLLANRATMPGEVFSIAHPRAAMQNTNSAQDSLTQLSKAQKGKLK